MEDQANLVYFILLEVINSDQSATGYSVHGIPSAREREEMIQGITSVFELNLTLDNNWCNFIIHLTITGMKTKYLLISILVLVFIVAGSLLILKFFNSDEPDENSIAVLPFMNDSSDESNSDLSYEMTSGTINGLAKDGDLKVISSTSVETFKNSTMSIPELGETLNVKYILEGSIQRNENSIRLTVQLVDAISGTHLWANTYEYEMNEINDFSSVQSRIVQDIAAEI